MFDCFLSNVGLCLLSAAKTDSVPHGGFIKSLQTSPLWKDPFRNPNVFLYLMVRFTDTCLHETLTARILVLIPLSLFIDQAL